MSAWQQLRDGLAAPPTRPLLEGLGLAFAVLLVDQISKFSILDFFADTSRPLELTPFFNLVLTWNTGVSFGLFASGVAAAWIFILLSLAIVVGLAIWLARADRRALIYALGPIIGGALGNVLDRLFFGAVIDFLDFHAGGVHWPAFNVADAAIFIGAAILIFDSLFGKPESPKKGAEEPEEGNSKE